MAGNGDNLSQNSATVSEFGDSRRVWTGLYRSLAKSFELSICCTTHNAVDDVVVGLVVNTMSTTTRVGPLWICCTTNPTTSNRSDGVCAIPSAFEDMLFLLRDASAERGDATVSRPSVCLSVCPSVTFRYQQHIYWNSSKIISRPNSLDPLLWLTPNMGDLVQREHPQN